MAHDGSIGKLGRFFAMVANIEPQGVNPLKGTYPDLIGDAFLQFESGATGTFLGGAHVLQCLLGPRVGKQIRAAPRNGFSRNSATR